MQNSNNKFIERCKKILGLANIKTTEDDGWDCIEKFVRLRKNILVNRLQYVFHLH